jgi:23S rRNA (adenine-N6)-dimethyltransferase
MTRQTARDDRRRSLAQNFLDRRLAGEIVEGASIGSDDLVVEIGGGSGALTTELVERAGKLLVIEADPAWADNLRARFGTQLEVIYGDILKVPVPKSPFRVVSNLPFNQTTPILRYLFDEPSSGLYRADLIVQWEVAQKRSREQGSLLSTEWAPWWKFRNQRRIPALAFRPVPRTDAGLLVATRRDPPLLPTTDRRAFVRLVRAAFDEAGGSLPRALRPVLTKVQLGRLAADLGFDSATWVSELTPEQWLGIHEFVRARKRSQP